MSTYQPPGGQQPEGTPGYAQPQDPWEGGFEPGLASVPTDPIPQQYDPYGNAYTQPGSGQDGVWSQQTVAQGGYSGYAPQPQKSKAGMIVLVSLIVVLLAGGGGFGAWWLTTHPPNSDPGTSPTTPGPGPATTPAATTPGTEPSVFDPLVVNVGDCLINDNPGDPNNPNDPKHKNPKMRVLACGSAGTYEVLKIVEGGDIPQDGDGVLSVAEAQEACKGSGYTNYYQSDNDGTDRDLVFCMKKSGPG